jgi:hypothetical protein
VLTRMPTRFLASTDVHPASATPWLESALHNLDVYRSRSMHTAGAPLNGPTQVTTIRFRALLTASTPHKQHSIAITLPR